MVALNCLNHFLPICTLNTKLEIDEIGLKKSASAFKCFKLSIDLNVITEELELATCVRASDFKEVFVYPNLSLFRKLAYACDKGNSLLTRLIEKHADNAHVDGHLEGQFCHEVFEERYDFEHFARVDTKKKEGTRAKPGQKNRRCVFASASEE